MTGNYGGEVLRRVRAFKPIPPAAAACSPPICTQTFWTQPRTYNDVVQGHPLSFAVFRQAPWHHYGLLALEQTQLSLRSPYLDNDFVRTVFRAPASAVTTNDACLRLIAEGDKDLLDIPTDRGGAGGLGQFAAAASAEFSRVPVQGGVCLRLRHAAVGGRHRSRVGGSPSRAAVSGAAQVLPLSRVVPRRPRRLRPGDAARPAHAVTSVSDRQPRRSDGAGAPRRHTGTTPLPSTRC